MLAAAPAISVRNLRKDYGSVHALTGIDLDIERGEVFAMLGPNGAGKTTLTEILEGYRRRSHGDATVLNVDPAEGDRMWRARLGIVLQSTYSFADLAVEEVVEYFRRFYPAPLPLDALIDLAGLEEKRHARCGTLSGGQRRRVDLAIGMAGDPELIFLDEPTTGFDPEARRHTWDVVREFASRGKTVLLTTHYLDEAEALADRVGVIVSGELLGVAPPKELGGRARGKSCITLALTGGLAAHPLPPLPGAVVVDGTAATIVTDAPTATVAALIAWAREAGVDELPAFAVTRPSLEDVYLAMTGHEAATTRGAEAIS